MDASEKMKPFLIEYPGCKASKKTYETVNNMSVKNVDYSNKKFIKIFEQEIRKERKKRKAYFKKEML